MFSRYLQPQNKSAFNLGLRNFSRKLSYQPSKRWGDEVGQRTQSPAVEWKVTQAKSRKFENKKPKRSSDSYRAPHENDSRFRTGDAAASKSPRSRSPLKRTQYQASTWQRVQPNHPLDYERILKNSNRANQEEMNRGNAAEQNDSKPVTTRQIRKFANYKQRGLSDLMRKVKTQKDLGGFQRFLIKYLDEMDAYNLGAALYEYAKLQNTANTQAKSETVIKLLEKVHVKLFQLDAFSLSNMLLSMNSLRVDCAPNVMDDYIDAVSRRANKMNEKDIANCLRGVIVMKSKLKPETLKIFENTLVRDMDTVTSHGFSKIIWGLARMDAELDEDSKKKILEKTEAFKKRIPADNVFDLLFALQKFKIRISDEAYQELRDKENRAKNLAADRMLEEAKEQVKLKSEGLETLATVSDDSQTIASTESPAETTTETTKDDGIVQ